MVEVAKFQLRLTGGMTTRHEFEAYDGFTSLAGAAFALSLVTNYIETGEIRYRGDFPGRHAVHASPMLPGSLIADFSVLLENNPATVLGVAGATAASNLLYGLVNRVISRNVGQDVKPINDETAALLAQRRGDVEALVARTEPSIRQAHEVIGNGAEKIEWIGGFSPLANMDSETKNYMRASVKDEEILERDVSVSGFYGNSGHGSVYDATLGRNVPIGMSKDTLNAYGTFFSWGLHQYINNTGLKIRIKFTRILALNGRPKRYIILSASEAPV